jgi:endogenous inhibitor of DNA gyrase (YacG/DUF329 family)
MATHDWELDFSPNPQTSVCPQCGQVYIADASIRKEVWTGKETAVYAFCSTRCSHDYYLARLRESL